MVRKIGNFYVAYSPTGKVLGRHRLKGIALGMVKKGKVASLEHKTETNLLLEDPRIKAIQYVLKVIENA